MSKYIAVRDFSVDDIRVPKSSIIDIDDNTGRNTIYLHPDRSELVGYDLPDSFSVLVLPLTPDLFKTSFHSFAYINWMKEKAADIGDDGKPIYQDLVKSPETLIMYLMELGVSADTIFRYMFGPENKYLEYKYLVQEFGKML